MGVVKRYILMAVGSILVVLGVIGIFLPVMPTTPFLLLAAGCFLNSSEKLYQRLISHKFLGKYVKNYHEHKAIPRISKFISITFLWCSIVISYLFIVNYFWGRIVLLAIGITVTLYLLSLRTLREEISEQSIQQRSSNE